MRIVGAMGMDGVSTNRNTLTATMAWNSCSGNLPLIVAQGAGGVATGSVTDNRANCHFLSDTSSVASESFIVSNGLAGNQAEVQGGGHAWAHKEGNLLS
jgi:hypothetical protein